MTHELCCPAVCGIFPEQRRNLCPLRWQAYSQPLDHQGSPKGPPVLKIPVRMWPAAPPATPSPDLLVPALRSAGQPRFPRPTARGSTALASRPPGYSCCLPRPGLPVTSGCSVLRSRLQKLPQIQRPSPLAIQSWLTKYCAEWPHLGYSLDSCSESQASYLTSLSLRFCKQKRTPAF